MGCSSSSSFADEGVPQSAADHKSDLDSVTLDDLTTESDFHPRTIQLTAHKAKQEASLMMKNPDFRSRPQEEQLALQREFIDQMQDMLDSEVRSRAIAKAMLQQLLHDELFLELLGLQEVLDFKEQVQLAAETSHTSSYVQRNRELLQ